MASPTPESSPAPERPDARGPLLTGALAALLASTCCLGPLLLLGLGVSGAWIGDLTVLEPWRPLFIAWALAALGLAARRLWRRAPACGAGAMCALPHRRRRYKLMFGAVVLLVGVALAFPWLAPLFY